jgi:hypothetical protein
MNKGFPANPLIPVRRLGFFRPLPKNFQTAEFGVEAFLRRRSLMRAVGCAAVPADCMPTWPAQRAGSGMSAPIGDRGNMRRTPACRGTAGCGLVASGRRIAWCPSRAQRGWP